MTQHIFMSKDHSPRIVLDYEQYQALYTLYKEGSPSFDAIKEIAGVTPNWLHRDDEEEDYGAPCVKENIYIATGQFNDPRVFIKHLLGYELSAQEERTITIISGTAYVAYQEYVSAQYKNLHVLSATVDWAPHNYDDDDGFKRVINGQLRNIECREGMQLEGTTLIVSERNPAMFGVE